MVEQTESKKNLKINVFLSLAFSVLDILWIMLCSFSLKSDPNNILYSNLYSAQRVISSEGSCYLFADLHFKNEASSQDIVWSGYHFYEERALAYNHNAVGLINGDAINNQFPSIFTWGGSESTIMLSNLVTTMGSLDYRGYFYHFPIVNYFSYKTETNTASVNHPVFLPSSVADVLLGRKGTKDDYSRLLGSVFIMKSYSGGTHSYYVSNVFDSSEGRAEEIASAIGPFIVSGDASFYDDDTNRCLFWGAPVDEIEIKKLLSSQEEQSYSKAYVRYIDQRGSVASSQSCGFFEEYLVATNPGSIDYFSLTSGVILFVGSAVLKIMLKRRFRFQYKTIRATTALQFSMLSLFVSIVSIRFYFDVVLLEFCNWLVCFLIFLQLVYCLFDLLKEKFLCKIK